VTRLNKFTILVVVLVMGLASALFVACLTCNLNQKSAGDYDNLVKLFGELQNKYDDLANENSNLSTNLFKLNESYSDLNESFTEFQKTILQSSEPNSTTTTILYYTNFGADQQIITISIPNPLYDFYNRKTHPMWNPRNLQSATTYVTYTEPIITQIVDNIKNQTKTKEELANALLDFVQYKQQGLSLKYYPTSSLKYPIETLVEMGGDCDTHAFLYASLMKAAGFKMVLLYSEVTDTGFRHAAAAVNLDTSPTNSLPNFNDRVFVYNRENYYFTETTVGCYRVGDEPKEVENLSYTLVPV
jgi:hypothetical protein